MPDALLEAFSSSNMAEQKKKQKSDDILEFIQKNWKLFCYSRQEMGHLVEELVQQHDYTVTGLADALGLPQCVVFKKVKMVDTAKAILNFEKSALIKLFNSTLNSMIAAGKGKFLCLFAVAGDHTVVITNLTTKRVPGLVHLSLAGDDETPDVNIIPYTDLLN